MADLGKLQIQISANMAPLVANLAEAEKMTRSYGSVSEAALGQVQKATAGATAQVAGLTKAMADQVTRTAAANNNIKLTGMQVKNLGYQLNDVGTMLAMGASPFAIISSQAGQVIQALGDGPGGVKGSLQAIGSSIAGLASRAGPVGLALGGVTLAAGALWYMLSDSSEVKTAEQSLETYQKLIAALEDGFDSAAGAAKKFYDEASQQSSSSVLADATKNAQDLKATLSEAISSLNVNETLDFRIDPGRVRGLDETREKIRDLYQDLVAGKIPASEFASKLADIQLNPNTPPQFQEFAAQIRALLPDVIALQAELGATLAAQSALMNNRSRLAVPSAQDRPQRSAAELALSDRMGDDSGMSDVRSSLKAQQDQMIADAKRAAKVPRKRREKKPADDYAEEVRQIQQRSSALQQETFIQAGLSATIDDYGYALTKSRIERELANVAEKQGIDITPEMAANIGRLSEGYAQATVAREKLTEAQDKARQAAEDLQNLEKDSLSGFITDMRNGVSAGEALANVFDKIIDKIQDDLVDALFSANSAASGAGGGGFLSSIFGLFTGGGGPISAGTSSAILGGAQGLFSRGGYTGDGSPTDIAGMVHGKEYVLNARATQSIGRGTLDAMNAGISIPKTIALPASASTASAGLGGSTSYAPSFSYSIDARGAQQGAAEELGAMMDQKLREHSKGDYGRFLKFRQEAVNRTGRR